MKITQAFTFEAAHHLPNVPDGHRCRNVHGHSYRVELSLTGPVDPHTGFVVDFFDVEAAFAPALSQLDHSHLNLVEDLANPTAENIAVWIWRRVRPHLPQLITIRVYETQNCWAEYEDAAIEGLRADAKLNSAIVTANCTCRASKPTQTTGIP